MKKLFILILLVSCYSCTTQTNSFDVVCDAYTKSTKQFANDHAAAFSAIKHDLTKSLAENDPAYVAWLAIIYAEPEQRYMLYQSAAADTLSSSWECKAMKKNAANIGM